MRFAFVIFCSVPIGTVAVRGEHIGAHFAHDHLVLFHGEFRVALFQIGGGNIEGFVDHTVILGGKFRLAPSVFLHDLLHINHQAGILGHVHGFGNVIAGLVFFRREIHDRLFAVMPGNVIGVGQIGGIHIHVEDGAVEDHHRSLE